MAKSKVYYTDFRAKIGEGLPTKLKRLIKAAGIGEIDMDNKFTAIKMHFGELGNISFLRPNYAKAVADVVKELGGSRSLQTATRSIRAAARMPWSTFIARGKTGSRRLRLDARFSSATGLRERMI